MGMAPRRPSRAVAWLVLIPGLALSVAASIVWGNLTGNERRDHLQGTLAEGEQTVTTEMARYGDALTAAAGLFAAEPSTGRRDFTRFASSLAVGQRLPGTDGLVYIARVRRGQEPGFVRARRADGSGGFTIRRAAFGGPMVGSRYIVAFAAPRPSWSSVGFDVSSVNQLWPALRRARDTGEAALSPRFTPFLDKRAPVKTDGFALFAPVYAGGKVPATLAERRDAIRGFVATRFVGDRFVPWVLRGASAKVRWELFDGTDPANDTQLAGTLRAGDPEPGLSATTGLTVAGRRWSLSAQALSGFSPTSADAEPRAILLGGALISLLLFALVSSLGRARDRAEGLVELVRANERKFKALAAKSPVGIWRCEAEGQLAYANSRFREIAQLDPDLPLDAAWQEAIHPDDRGMAERLVRPGGRGQETSTRLRLVTEDGEERRVEARAAELHDDEGRPSGYVGTLEDVTEREAFEAQLAHQALHDSLTGLPNRSLFLDRVGIALSRATRKNECCAVLFLDLDRFKLVNDSFGHDVGDELLCVVAGRLDETLRPGDTVARLGGDEFAVLCDVRSEDEAIALAERLIAAIERPVELHGDRTVAVSTSVGICFGSQVGPPGDLLRNADAAMYRAKDRGKARVEVFDESMRARTLQRLRTENALRVALDEDQFVLHYQPEVRLADGEVVGLEALIRWSDPDRDSWGRTTSCRWPRKPA